jgi:hypothetical protein
MVRANIFTSSLAVWKDRGEAAPLALPSRRRRQGSGENKFELFSVQKIL